MTLEARLRKVIDGLIAERNAAAEESDTLRRERNALRALLSRYLRMGPVSELLAERALLLGEIDRLSERLAAMQRNRCVYCGDPAPARQSACAAHRDLLTLDHDFAPRRRTTTSTTTETTPAT